MADSLKINVTTPSPSPTSDDPALFAHLKSQILSIAMALYGTSHPNPSLAFDILTYTTPLPSSMYILLSGRRSIPPTLYGVALITYPSPTGGTAGEEGRRCTAWERLATAESTLSIEHALGQLLGDLRSAVGAVMCESIVPHTQPQMGGLCAVTEGDVV